ncbi:MAG: hypothetical protein LW717_22985, partial [Chloroflexaceae bacterium]|nr:hypothetical protein [Chloroflexaceae bacterium]
FTQRLDPKIRRVQEIAEKEKTESYGLDVERTGQVRVYILASVCGGTGSGTFIDAAFRVRKALGDEAEIIGVFFLPSCFMPNMQSQVQKERVQGNAYAALRELNHFLSGGKFESTFPDTPFFDGSGQKVSTILGRPFDSVFLVDSHNGKEYMSDLREIQRMTAQFIYLDMITPIGKRLAGRRVNLNDLAGEQRSSGKRAKSAALAIAGFVTASLVLPATVEQEATNRYAAYVLDKFILGDESFVQQMHRQATQLVDTWKNTLTYNAQNVRNNTTRNFDLLLDITKRAVADINKSMQTRGLYDTAATVRMLANELTTWIADIEARVIVLEGDKKKHATNIANLNSKSNRIFSFLSRKDQDDDDAQERLVRMEKATDNELSYQKDVLSGLRHLLGSLNDIKTKVDDAISTCKGWKDKLTQDEGKIVIDKQKSRAQKPSDLFELATEIGDEKAVEEPGQQQFTQKLLSHYISDRVRSIDLKGADKQTIMDAVHALQLLQISCQVEDNQIKVKSEVTSNSDMLTGYKKTIEGFLSVNNGVFSKLNVSDYLNWFYTNVPYATADSNASRNSPIDPLRQLRYRSYAPFLNIDSAQLGTEHAFDTEPVRLVGASPLPSASDLEYGLHPLDEFGGDTFDMIDTGMRNRLDVLYARFGYKVDDLANLNDYYKSYRYFTETLGDPLHIHRDWPQGMMNLVDEPAQIAMPTNATPRARLRAIGDGWSHPRHGRAVGAEAVIHRSIELASGFTWTASLIADDLDADSDELSRLWIRRVSQSLEQSLRQGAGDRNREERLRNAFEKAQQQANEDVNTLVRQQGKGMHRLAYAAVIIEDDCMLAVADKGSIVRIHTPKGTPRLLSGNGDMTFSTLHPNDIIVLASDGIREGYYEDTLNQAIERYLHDPRMIIDRVIDGLRSNTQRADISLIAVRMIEA